MIYIIKGEVFGAPVDVEISNKVEGTKLVQTVSCVLPQFDVQVINGQPLIAVLKPRSIAELSDRERREMELNGWIKRK